MKNCLPFTSLSSMSPMAFGCAGGGPDCGGAIEGGSGFCVPGAGDLPEPPGFPVLPATASKGGGLTPVLPCPSPQVN